MPIYLGSQKIKTLYVGAQKIKEAWMMVDGVPTKVFQTAAGGDVWVPITGGSALISRDQARAAATAQGINWATATAVPFGFDCAGATNIQSLLSGWSGLQSAAVRNTSNVTSMSNMFRGCAALTSVPVMDTSKVTSTSYMFMGCTLLTSVPAIDTSKVTNVTYMFAECKALTSVPALDTSNVTNANMNGMFDRCTSLTSIPAMDTSKVTAMAYMFRGCDLLTSVPALDASNVTNMVGMFDGCPELSSIGIYGAKVTFSVAGTKLAAPALNALFGQLGTANAGATLTITGTPGAATCDRSIATAKGWTVTG